MLFVGFQQRGCCSGGGDSMAGRVQCQGGQCQGSRVGQVAVAGGGSGGGSSAVESSAVGGSNSEGGQ